MRAEVIYPSEFHSVENLDFNRFGFPQEYKEHLKPSENIDQNLTLNLINTRLLIDEVSRLEQRPVKIDEISEEFWSEKLKDYDIAWFMGIYKPGEMSKKHAINYEWQYRHAIPDLKPENDISGSPYSIADYSPNPLIAEGWETWNNLAEIVNNFDKKVLIDFVPNHVGIDHEWALSHPEYFIRGTTEQYSQDPLRYQKYISEDGQSYYLAHGKDPNYPQWVDVLQLNYANPQVQKEMENLLLNLVEHSDGVRCDLAMLINADTFIQTWGSYLSEVEKNYIKENNFWEKVIPKVKERAREIGKDNFLFIAEAYWDKEEIGKYFDYVYNSDLYNKIENVIKNDHVPSADLIPHIRYLMQNKRNYKDVNYTENHDEERSITKFGENPSKAAAVVVGLLPDSIFLVHDGQELGSRIKPPAQISRKPKETPDRDMELFYERLMALKRSKLFQEGDWSMADLDTQNENIIGYKVSISTDVGEVGAYVCVNLGRHMASGRIPEIDKFTDVSVYRLMKGDIVLNPDMERNGGIFMELLSWESQVFFYKK